MYMIKSTYILICILILSHPQTGLAQTYIGGGNDQGIIVTASSQYNQANWPKAASANHTINGSGLDAKEMEASRFLTQASLGFDVGHIDDVVDQGIESWIDAQIQLPQTMMLPKVEQIYQIIIDSMAVKGDAPQVDEFRPRWWDFNYAWWDQMMRNDDLLRHRVAFALSEIFVVSRKSDLSNFGDGLASYYDMLAKNAFGNYEDLLRDVTLHPVMGEYLSHLNNPKADPSKNIHPDENYAREIMQLFSIGLYELDMEGSRLTTSSGDYIPTYGQDDIREFAKVFTGLGVSGVIDNPYNGNDNLYFGRGIWVADVTQPMMMYNEEHDQEEKKLLKGYTIPAGQNGMADINGAIHNLATHPNVGPFIAYRLIQRLVKSNPTGAYVARVSEVFNNNGNGVRGDMGAVVKAILMDGEARACSYLSDDKNSKLKEPLLKYVHFARAVNKSNPLDYYWNVNYEFSIWVNQDLMNSPSVFNFYLPDHQPNGDIADQGLVAPEFNLHNTLTAPGYMNQVNRWIVSWGRIMSTWEGDWMADTEVKFDIDYYKLLAADVETFINELDKVFTHGNLSVETRDLLRTSLNQLDENVYDKYLEYRVRIGVYIILISPDYAVLR